MHRSTCLGTEADVGSSKNGGEDTTLLCRVFKFLFTRLGGIYLNVFYGSGDPLP
ncbi:MAG: hypothetical protein IJZ89_07760 [Clostridia bacterium]|nr:hypothetical protein [Clostridia bacterium]